MIRGIFCRVFIFILLDFYVIICFFARLFVSLQPQTKIVRIMTVIQLRAELFREISPLLDSEAAMEKMLTFVRTLVPAKKAEAGWADRFVGAWKDDRSADEIVKEIRSARTANTIDVEL